MLLLLVPPICVTVTSQSKYNIDKTKIFDPCLCILSRSPWPMSIDIIICTSDMQYMVEIKCRFLDRYNMTDMGRLTTFLNIRITCEETGMRLDKQRYAEKVLCKHAGLVRTGITKNPLPSNATNVLAEDTKYYSLERSVFVRPFPYLDLVDDTLYMAMHTRPGVAYAVGGLSRQFKQPSLAPCKLMVYLLKYIQGSPDKGIRFCGSSFDIHVFSDLD